MLVFPNTLEALEMEVLCILDLTLFTVCIKSDQIALNTPTIFVHVTLHLPLDLEAAQPSQFSRKKILSSAGHQLPHITARKMCLKH